MKDTTQTRLINTISSKNRQQGLVLVVTLLALVIMMLASVALIRSTDTNLQIAGNMAFKRDLINQAERAIPQIQKLFKTGVLSNEGQRFSSKPGSNYYATVEASNDSGIPTKLLDGTIAIGNVNNIIDVNSGVTIRYIIDRMCLKDGSPDADDNMGACTKAGTTDGEGGGGMGEKTITKTSPIYRMTLRINGPRNTEAFLQTTYSDG